MTLAPPAPPSGGLISALGSVQLKVTQVQEKEPDARNDLLGAIRRGKNLRKVEHQEIKPATMTAGGDVASILARRIAVEFSDSDDDGDDDDGEWDDDDDDDWN